MYHCTMDERTRVSLSLSKLAFELSVIGLASSDDSRLDTQNPEVEYDVLKAFVDRIIATREEVDRLEMLAAKWLDEFLSRHGRRGLELIEAEKPYVWIVQEMLRMRRAGLEEKLYAKCKDTSDLEKRRFFLSILKKEGERKKVTFAMDCNGLQERSLVPYEKDTDHRNLLRCSMMELELAERCLQAENGDSHKVEESDKSERKGKLEPSRAKRVAALQLEKIKALSKLEKASNSDSSPDIEIGNGQSSPKVQQLPSGRMSGEQKPSQTGSFKKEKYPAEYDPDVDDDYWVRSSAEKLYRYEMKYQDDEDEWQYKIEKFKSRETVAVEKVLKWNVEVEKKTEVTKPKRPCWLCGKPGVNRPRNCPNKHNHYLYRKSETPKKFIPKSQTKGSLDDEDEW